MSSKPDVSFATSSFKSGHSTPVFIIKKGDYYYLTKVVWPYHVSLAGPDTDWNTIPAIKAMYDNNIAQKYDAHEILSGSGVESITEGFAK